MISGFEFLQGIEALIAKHSIYTGVSFLMTGNADILEQKIGTVSPFFFFFRAREGISVFADKVTTLLIEPAAWRVG